MSFRRRRRRRFRRERKEKNLSLSFSLSLFPYLEVVRGRAQELRASVVGRVAAPELGDLAHGAVVLSFVFPFQEVGEKVRERKGRGRPRSCRYAPPPTPPSAAFCFQSFSPPSALENATFSAFDALFLRRASTPSVALHSRRVRTAEKISLRRQKRDRFFLFSGPRWRKKERKKKTHALSQLRHRSPAHSPQRSQLPCATGKIQRRPPGLAREQERGGHLGRWCGEKKNKRKNKLLWPMVFFLLLLLFSFSHNFFLSFFFACCLLSGEAEERDQRINTNDGGTRARAQRCV